MAYTNETVRAVNNGNGVTTSFNFSFLVPDTGSLSLTYIATDGVETTVSTAGLTISGIGATAGGTVSYAPGGTPIATGTKFVIERASPYSQESSFTNQDGYYPATTEEALDWLVYQTQQNRDAISRAILVSVGNDSALGTLPIESVRAGYLVGFDTAGNVTTAIAATAVNAGVLGPFLAASSLPAAVAALGATTIGQQLFTAASSVIARATLGATTIGQELFTAASALTARNTLGATTTGNALYTAATDTAARSTLGLTNAFINTVVQVFTTSGTYTATANMFKAIVEAVGGGGGGGGGSGATAGGGGGGAGAYGRTFITAGITSAAVTIGTGGAGGTSTNLGSTGGSTTIAAVLTCSGGTGGNPGNGTNGAQGGAGASAPTADVAIAGGDGQSAGAITGSIGGSGAASYFGGGGRGGTSAVGPNNASAKGGGGGGAYGGGTGGNGANGIVVITEFIRAN